jgi:hypothetical protein
MGKKPQTKTEPPRDPEVIEAVAQSRRVLERNRILIAELAGLEVEIRRRRQARGGSR